MALLTNVCRLCLVTEDLVWVFDRKLPGIQNNSLKDIIFATSGVEIYQKDAISQKICSKCCQISMKMFQFREQSLKNDKILKNQYAELLKNAKIKLKIPNTDITITAEKVETKKEVKNDSSNTRYRIHPSVTALFKDNPQIRLPSVCLKSNIAPCVSLEMHAVEKYLRNRKLSIEKFSQLSLKSNRKVAKKKGSAKPISKLKTFEVPKIPSSVSRSKCVDPLRVVSTRATLKSGSTKENTHKPLPSNIKKHQDFKIVDVSKIRAQDNSKSSDDSDTSTRQKPVRLKRKLSTDDSSTKVEPKVPAIIESLGLTPKMKSNGDSTGTLYVDNKSVPLFICDICNSVQYNARDLKRHMLKHLRCQFCKLKFRSIDIKADHIEKYCRIKNMMNNLPAVELEKIELKLTVRRKYPEAFSGFPSLPGLELEEKNNSDDYLNDEKATSVESEKENDCDNNINDEKSTFVESTQKCTKNTVPESSDIIEIISDDEDSTPRITSELSTAVSGTLIESSKDKEYSTGISSAFSINPSSPSIHNIGPNVINKPPAATILNTTVSAENPAGNTRNISGSINQRNSVPVTIQNVPCTDLEQNSSSYVVKPEILIRNVSILDKFEPKATDTNIVKDLLIQLGKFHSDGTTQTELPSNDSIIVNKAGRTIEMKNLRYLLFIYKIPVHINKGDFKISFNYEAPALREKKLCLWNDLVAIDLKGTNDNVDTVSSRTISSPLPQSENTTTAADSFNSNSGVTIQQPTNINNQISTVMKSSQININPCDVPVIATLNTGNTIISPSAPSLMSCIQTPRISFSPNNTSIPSDPCPVNSVCVDAETTTVSTAVSKVSDTQTPSISFTPNSTDTSERPSVFINTMNTNAGQVTIGRPISSEMSYVQPPAISFDPISSSNSGSSAFFINTINTIAENAIINTPSLSEISCIQPAENSFTPDSLSISSPSAFSINNAISENTTTGTCISTAIGCILPSPSISFNLPTTTSVHQISSTSVNTNPVTNAHPDVNRSCDDSAAMNISLTVQDAFPISESLTPISTPLAPINNALTPVSTSLTPISAPLTHVNAPLTPVSAPQISMITPFIPVSATLGSSPALPLSIIPTSTVTEANSVSVADSGPVSNSVAVAGRVGIRVKNLCELT